ncbi:MAG TPA: hypothetical protein VGJ08_00945, partial [Rhizomicrobium sp.]
RLNERVDDESAPGLALAVFTMAAMYEHRRRVEPIFHRAAEALPFQCLRHVVLVGKKFKNLPFNSRLSKPALDDQNKKHPLRKTKNSSACIYRT